MGPCSTSSIFRCWCLVQGRSLVQNPVWGIVDGDINVAQHVDLLIGMVPIVNLEWIQKFVRDTRDRGHSREAVMDSIVRSMDDYLNFIFEKTP